MNVSFVCMRKSCPKCKSSDFKRDGKYYRKSDGKSLQRYRCRSCFKRFSNAINSPCYGQNKRRVNLMVYKLLASGNSMRRIALILNIARKTVERKLLFLASQSLAYQKRMLHELEERKVKHILLDDLITIEHTKLKPLSVSVLVENKTRKILGLEVSRIPAFGHLSGPSKRKYGYRENKLKNGLNNLFCQVKKSIDPNVLIDSDEHVLYSNAIKKHFPQSTHRQYKSERACVFGQGELKKTKFDPLFYINHTFAMLRDNVSRLVRKTWCTTKDPRKLKMHLLIYLQFHNQTLIKAK